MSILRGIKNNFKKSEAAVVVQNLLEMQVNAGLLDLDPAKTANKLVEALWSDAQHMLDGRKGQRPHKITFAASALAHAIDSLDERDPDRSAFLLCLGTVLGELDTNGALYPLSTLDHHLIGAASGVFIEASQSLAASPLGQEIDAILQEQNVSGG